MTTRSGCAASAAAGVFAVLSANGWIAYGSFSTAAGGDAHSRYMSGVYGIVAAVSALLAVAILVVTLLTRRRVGRSR
jgi:hypothetical protein